MSLRKSRVGPKIQRFGAPRLGCNSGLLLQHARHTAASLARVHVHLEQFCVGLPPRCQCDANTADHSVAATTNPKLPAFLAKAAGNRPQNGFFPLNIKDTSVVGDPTGRNQGGDLTGVRILCLSHSQPVLHSRPDTWRPPESLISAF